MALGNNMNFDLHISNKGKEMQDKTDELKTESSESIAQKKSQENEISAVQEKDAVPETSVIPEFLQAIEAQGLKVNFTPSRRKTTRRVSISIEGDFTVSTVSRLKERIPGIFENFDYADFVLRNINMDLAGIQLLHVITKIYSPLEKHISIDAEFSKDEKALIGNCGFSDLFSKQKLSV